jgi:hypothetical protein
MLTVADQPVAHSFRLFHRFHINLVVILVRSDPFDKYDLVTIVDGHDPPISIQGEISESAPCSLRVGRTIISTS